MMENPQDRRTAGQAVLDAVAKEFGMRTCDDGVAARPGVRIERVCGAVKVATVDLGTGSRLGVAGTECWIDVDGRLPGVVTAALPGMPLEAVLRHRWTDGSGIVVFEVERGEDRTRLHLARS